jgi:hypothetical protein
MIRAGAVPQVVADRTRASDGGRREDESDGADAGVHREGAGGGVCAGGAPDGGTLSELRDRSAGTAVRAASRGPARGDAHAPADVRDRGGDLGGNSAFVQTLASYLTRIVIVGTRRAAGKRPGKVLCESHAVPGGCTRVIETSVEQRPDRPEWWCQVCGYDGCITGWEGTRWDRSTVAARRKTARTAGRRRDSGVSSRASGSPRRGGRFRARSRSTDPGPSTGSSWSGRRAGAAGRCGSGVRRSAARGGSPCP